MGFTDFFTDAWETFAHPSPDADQPPVQGGTSTQSPASGTDEESGEEAEVNKQDQKKGGESGEQGHKPSGKSDDGDDEEPEEEEEEEEVPDPKETLEKGESPRIINRTIGDQWSLLEKALTDEQCLLSGPRSIATNTQC